MNKTCPRLSKLCGYPFQDEYNRERMDYRLEEVECLEEKCQLWTRDEKRDSSKGWTLIPGHCGLIKEEK